MGVGGAALTHEGAGGVTGAGAAEGDERGEDFGHVFFFRAGSERWSRGALAAGLTRRGRRVPNNGAELFEDVVDVGEAEAVLVPGALAVGIEFLGELPNPRLLFFGAVRARERIEAAGF